MRTYDEAKALVNIADVFDNTTSVSRLDIEVGDRVFDVFGGQHAVAKVQRFKAHTTIVRDDGVVDVLAGDETMTVMKGSR